MKKFRQRLVSILGQKILVFEPDTKHYGHMAFELMANYRLAEHEKALTYMFVDKKFPIVNEGLLAYRPARVRLVRSGTLLGFLVGGIFSFFKLSWTFFYYLRENFGYYRDKSAEIKTKYPNSWRAKLSEQFMVRYKKFMRKVELFVYPKNSKFLISEGGNQYHRFLKLFADKDNPPAAYFRRTLIEHHVPVDLDQKTQQEVWSVLGKLGLTIDSKIVTVHVREPGFKIGREISDKPGSNKDEAARNADIENYRLAFEMLVDQGFSVVRIGDSSMKPFKMDGVIDLCHFEGRTALLEVFLIQKSVFFLGCESGPYHVAYFTNTPSLIVNATDPICSFPLRKNYLYLLKRVVNNKSGKQLGTKEILSAEYFENLRNVDLYSYIENSPDEIKTAVVEMLNTLKTWGEDTETQMSFKQELLSAAKELHFKNIYVLKWGHDLGFIGNGRIVSFQATDLFRNNGLNEQRLAEV
jgi:putative glycosyltransferase (TIGR04372 family)